MRFFPENKTTCFTTQLPRQIQLVGEWSVGISEIHIPYTISHIRAKSLEQTFAWGLSAGSKNFNTENSEEKNHESNNIDKNSVKVMELPHGIYKNTD